MSWKSGSVNLLEPSGPHRACYGTALTLYLLWDIANIQPTIMEWMDFIGVLLVYSSKHFFKIKHTFYLLQSFKINSVTE
jgi:hypothetical protein